MRMLIAVLLATLACGCMRQSTALPRGGELVRNCLHGQRVIRFEDRLYLYGGGHVVLLAATARLDDICPVDRQ
jgi:hypothetical protein